ncbi:MAG: hydroxylamine reductase, partial [Desulfosudaceae bacterium]
MFCFQCQETAKNQGCTVKGVCGKPEETADLQDVLIYVCKGIAVYGEKLKEQGTVDREAGRFICQALFTTITNVAWDDEVIIERVNQALQAREAVKAKAGEAAGGDLPDCATWTPAGKQDIMDKALADEMRITADENEDARSLRQMLIIGLKGIAAYADHAAILGHEQDDIYGFIMEALVSTTRDLSVDEMVGMVMKAGEISVNTMALLDEANTSAYGHPEITEVNLGVRDNPGILISGHDLKDMEELLAQTEGTGVDVYTHGEMLPAHGYPELKKYDHLVGNYGGAWQRQQSEFDEFPGAILMTTNCLMEPKQSYKDRIFSAGPVGFPGMEHIDDGDFSPVIEAAKNGEGFTEDAEPQEITVGFGRNAVMNVADTVVHAVKGGDIRHFFLIGGCDGAKPGRNYYTELAESV